MAKVRATTSSRRQPPSYERLSTIKGTKLKIQDNPNHVQHIQHIRDMNITTTSGVEESISTDYRDLNRRDEN
ncbi:MAG: hypothetical protein QXL15_00360 [Candidatus Korarchaeota archaeon]